MKLLGKIFKAILLIGAVLAIYFLVFDVSYTCTLFSNKLGCYDGNLRWRLNWLGADNSRDYLKKLHDDGFLTQGQCHTLGHRVGQNAASKGVGMQEAMEESGSFCAWAFFHGVMEGLFGEGAGHGRISVEEAHQICKEAENTDQIEIFNCYHALGHGFYALDYDLDKSLDRCDLAEDHEKAGFCYDGIFMAATFPKEGPRAKESDPEPFSLCGRMKGEESSLYCYWRLLPIKVFVEELELPSSDYILEISEKVPLKYKKIFWNGFGRELDSRFASDPEIISSACSWGGDEFKFTCIDGSATHMIFYDKGETKRAEKLCQFALENKEKSDCLYGVNSQKYPAIPLN